MAKTWKQKLENLRPAQVEVLDKPMMGLPAGTRLLIATPILTKECIEKLKPGESLSVPELRRTLAEDFQADATCPLTTGIFVRIAAEAALDELRAGKDLDAITPFWRVVDPKSPLAKKLSCGPDFVREQRTREGI
jgi:hypothetical protein